MSKTKILLLTNRDSDNIGDQIIEATVISLLRGVMKNLGLSVDDFSINSRAAGIISKKYMKTGDPALLENARKLISESDIVVFGGAPLFNYSYQNFYLRTIKTLELAEEYGVPVIFSSIGVEPFDPQNPKCLRLKEALALPCVRQITTRDDFASLQAYMEGTDTPIAHVSDPAVFADVVFRKPEPIGVPAAPRNALSVVRSVLRRVPVPVSVKSRVKNVLTGRRATAGHVDSSPAPARVASDLNPSPEAATPRRKKIGLIVTRAEIFKDNGIEFSEQDQRKFWLQTRRKLISEGYDVRFFTTGHFTDEVFLDALVRAEGIPASQAAVVINSPEGLIDELKACDGVIAYRLHASITSFALGIPSVGLSWNFKVPYFYDSVGYGERALEPKRWTADEVVPVLETAIAQGVTKDDAFLASVYDSLFSGIKSIVEPTSEHNPFSFDELKTQLPPYSGTSAQQYREKTRSKMRRSYESYQKLVRRSQTAAKAAALSPEQQYLRFLQSKPGAKQEYLRFRGSNPVDSSIVFYESMDGDRINDNPLAIFEYLRAHSDFGHFTHVWSIKKGMEIPEEYLDLDDVVFVQKGSLEFQRYLATAGYIIRNVGTPDYFIRRPEQRYLNTWHGIPYKTLGRDAAKAKFGAPETMANFFKATHLITACTYMGDKILPAYCAQGASTVSVAETGYPRVDATVKASSETRRLLRERLGLGSAYESEKVKPVVLYAPTWRADDGKTSVDIDGFVKALQTLAGLDIDLLFRGHHRVSRLIEDIEVGAESGGVIVPPQDISSNELMSVVDILITDYSSIFFDFLPTGRPIVHYLYDLEDYTKARGVYLTPEELPGVLAGTTAELENAVRRLSEELQRTGVNTDFSQLPLQGEPYRRAQERFSPREDGYSAQRAVEFFFGEGVDSDLLRSARDQRPSTVFWTGQLGRDASSRKFLESVKVAVEASDRQITLVLARASSPGPEVIQLLKSYGPRLSVVPYNTVEPPVLLPEERADFMLFILGGPYSAIEVETLLSENTVLRDIMEREYRRRFDDAHFDELVLGENLSSFELALTVFARHAAS